MGGSLLSPTIPAVTEGNVLRHLLAVLNVQIFTITVGHVQL